MNKDEEHLNLLAIFHYILGGLTALFACVPLIQMAFGLAILAGAFEGSGAPPEFLGWLFVVFPACLAVFGWILAGCMIAAGRKLQTHRARTFCLVVAGFECVLMPYGTVLGVFTIVVLMRDSVRELFEAGDEMQAMW
jgi:hypothetical protein